MCKTEGKIRNTHYLYIKKNMKIRDILYNGKTADRIEVGFSFSNRPKLSENTPGGHHASSYHSF